MDRYWLPDEDLLGFITVEAGPFMMGSDPATEAANDDDMPQHVVDLPDYYIGRYPVTVAQFRVFVEDTHFQVEDTDCLRGVPNHPVVRVSFHEASWYCDWLTAKLRRAEWTSSQLLARLRDGWVITVPSEAEWEKAARGQDGRIYPWGSQFDSLRTNAFATGLGTTSAVGLFPSGRSPYGVLDMCGNVWEWTRSVWGDREGRSSFPYPYEPREASREDLHAANDVLRVTRGGAFVDFEPFLSVAFRLGQPPSTHHSRTGFRAVCSHLHW
jgi:formylglycine-generating enzyme required for sulfatase activity